jgi:phosphoribosylaminoimidazolecarboxamide formyltransferase/IMP cyclohydrolase
MADADCILNTLCLAAEAFILNTGSTPYLCVAAKHGNACGMGVSKVSPAQTVEKALFGNPRSIWGGEVITNFPVDEQIAEVLYKSKHREHLLGDSSWMLDLVMAPSFTSEAISVLGKRKGRKLLENEALQSPSLNKSRFVYRTVRGGFLRQPPATYILDLKACQLDGHNFSESEIASLVVAWAVAFSSNHGGNEVALAKDGSLLSAGGGASTVEATKVAVARATDCGHDTKGAAFAADAFFPFTDAPSVFCDAGVAIGSVPGGGKHETDIKDFFHTRGKSVAYIPQEFRGFCRH